MFFEKEKVRLIILILVFCSIAQSAILKVTKVTDIAPAWSGNPVQFALLTNGDKQFVAFYDGNRQLAIGTRNINNGVWELQKLDEYVTLDAHNYVALAIDCEGYLHMCANMHVASLKYWRSRNPFDINSFEQINKMVGQNEQKCTYPVFFTGPKGEFLFKYRNGMSGDGKELVNEYDVAAKKWKRFLSVPLLDGNSSYGTMCAYQSGPIHGPDRYYHMAWVWRDMFGCEFNHTLQYARSKNLLDWETSDGKSINLPIKINNGETLDSVGVMGGMLNTIQISFDGLNRPIVTYLKFDQDGDTQLQAARREIDGWHIYQMTDWIGRWDFNGGGTIKTIIGMRGPKVWNGSLLLRFQNRFLYGVLPREYAYLLDVNSLLPVSDAVEFFPDDFEKVKSIVPGMKVTYREDWSQFEKNGKVYILRWETLDAARDIVKNLDWVPKNQILQLLEMEEDKKEEVARSVVKSKDRSKTFKTFFDALNYEYDQKLDKVKLFAEQNDYLNALKQLRLYYLNRINPALPINPKLHQAVSFPLKSVKEADAVLEHEFTITGIKRTLPYDIETWEPIKPELLEEWATTRALMLETRSVGFDELEKSSSISRWYNELNTLSYLNVLGRAHFDTRNPRYARKLVHDIGDWSYDNPVPEKPSSYGPWYIRVAVARNETIMKTFCQLLDSPDVDDVEIFRLLYAIRIHCDYLEKCVIDDIGTSDDKRKASDALKRIAAFFPEFKNSGFYSIKEN
ncbi:MAG: BNR-4 repeat-containing protein [Phycisphaerales bacterium]